MSFFLSEEERWAIVILHKYGGWSNSHIYNTIKCSHTTISRLLQKYKETGDVKDKERSGRPPLLSKKSSEYRTAFTTVKRHRQFTSSQLSKYLKSHNNIDISRSTMHNLIQQWGFHPVHFRKKPLLTGKHKEKRMKFSIENEGEEWDDVIFTDEKIFYFGSEGVKLWKRSNEKEIPSFVPEQFLCKERNIWCGVEYGKREEPNYIYQKIISIRRNINVFYGII